VRAERLHARLRYFLRHYRAIINGGRSSLGAAAFPGKIMTLSIKMEDNFNLHTHAFFLRQWKPIAVAYRKRVGKLIKLLFWVTINISVTNTNNLTLFILLVYEESTTYL
jgi:hypothetical protein